MTQQTPVEYVQHLADGDLEVAESVTYTKEEVEEYLEGHLNEEMELGLEGECLDHVLVDSDDPDKYFHVFQRVSDMKYIAHAVQDIDTGEILLLSVEADNV